MFRVSQFMQEIAVPTAIGPRRDPPGPVVIWNLVRRCNLTCKHCYSVSADHDFPGELGTSEVFSVMDDLKAFRVPVLILSGGEPLLRPDLFDIARRAKEMGFYVGLSTNGTLIDGGNIRPHRRHRFRLRRHQPRWLAAILTTASAAAHGAFDASMVGAAALPRCRREGGRALYAHPRQLRRPAVAACDDRSGRHRQVLPVALELRRPRQREPQGRRPSRHDPRRDGSALRRLLGLPGAGRAQGIRHRQQRRRRRLLSALGASSLS